MIEIEELTKYYGERKGVGPLNFTIETGEVVGLLGLNGAGKTTTLRMLASDLLPTSGRMLIDGVDLAAEPEKVRPKIGYLPDRTPLYDVMPVWEYLTFAARLRGVPKAKAAARVDEVMAVTRLRAEADSPLGSLSHGYRQRVGIGQAIVHQPSLLLLDEPISGLDPVQIVEMREMVRSLRGEHTIVISSHILSEVSETCDRLLIIRDGEIIASGSEQELATKLTIAQTLHATVRLADEMHEDDLCALGGRLEGVRSAEAVPGEEGGEDVVTLEIITERDVRAELCQALVEAGAGVLGLRRVSHGELEDVFLRLTGSESEDPHSAQEEA